MTTDILTPDEVDRIEARPVAEDISRLIASYRVQAARIGEQDKKWKMLREVLIERTKRELSDNQTHTADVLEGLLHAIRD